MRKYISPRVEVLPVLPSVSILSTSGNNNMHIDNNGAIQVDAW